MDKETENWDQPREDRGNRTRHKNGTDQTKYEPKNRENVNRMGNLYTQVTNMEETHH